MTSSRVDLATLRSSSALAERRVLILGLARSGVAAARMAADVGAHVSVYDRRSAGELSAAVESLEGRDVTLLLAADPADVRQALAEADLVISSPSISARFPTTDAWLRQALTEAAEAGVPIVGEVDLVLRLTQARLIGVTGTKGKTTTASLIAAVLSEGGFEVALGGNIGIPLVERAEALATDCWVVLELSELQLPTISRGVDIAVYTNIAADHLDRHGSPEAYRAVKARLAELSSAGGIIVLNGDDAGCRELAASLPAAATVQWYGLTGAERGDAWLADGQLVVAAEPIMPASEVPLPGAHMVANALAAALVGRLVGVTPGAIRTAIAAFPGVPHRLETVVDHDGVRWVNDSQATIPLAAIAGLDAFSGPLVVIAGGAGKGLPLDEFANALAHRARAVILIGQTADELSELLAGRVPVGRADGMEDAVRQATELVRSGDVVLLAPAAASFDQFVDYADRGDAFRAAVRRLVEGSES
jgi:UDP-N-acetylmuramoylalanine--D-glutamate ligase